MLRREIMSLSDWGLSLMQLWPRTCCI